MEGENESPTAPQTDLGAGSDAASLMGQIIDAQSGEGDERSSAVSATPAPESQPPAPAVIPSAAELMQSIIDDPSRALAHETQPDSFYSDFLRAGALGAEDRADFPEAQTYAERGLLRMIQENKTAAYGLGAAVLNHLPELIKDQHNAGYVLRTLGLSPHLVEQTERLTALASLPQEVIEDMLEGDPEAANFTLQSYIDEQERVLEETRAQFIEAQQLEHQTTRTLVAEQRAVFDEFVERGRSLGLSELEAAGLAAMAYNTISEGYWDPKSAFRKVLDRWQGDLRSGNANRSKLSRADYKKTLDDAYKNVATKYKPSAGSKATAERRRGLNGSDLMDDLLTRG